MSWSGSLKVILGVLLTIALLVGGGSILTRMMVARLTALPPKPMYANDKPGGKSSPAKSTAPPNAKSEPSKPLAVSAAPKAKPKPTDTYEARVSQLIGLIVRDEPSPEGQALGSVEYNDRITVLETKSDGVWQKVRLADGKEGWVKAGNVEPITP